MVHTIPLRRMRTQAFRHLDNETETETHELARSPSSRKQFREAYTDILRKSGIMDAVDGVVVDLSQ